MLEVVPDEIAYLADKDDDIAYVLACDAGVAVRDMEEAAGAPAS